ncbi:MAG: nucleoside 2-deoxyribosyltransferase [archaeon]|nr:nucleoside 2-deoxyribosyltransferase [archaeon]
MKIFVSYRFSGENPKELKYSMENVCKNLEKNNKYFCSFSKEEFFLKQKFSNKQILEYSLKEMDKSDYVLVFLKSQEKSEGMLIEVGYAIAKKKKIILAIKKGTKSTFLREIAEQIIEFETLEELFETLSKLKV